MFACAYRVLTLCLIVLTLTACSAKKPVRTPVKTPPTIVDLQRIPQNLNAFLGTDAQKPILDRQAQAEQYQRLRRVFFGSWNMDKPSISRKEASLLLNRKARGWKDGSTRWKNEEWQAMRVNGNMRTYPNVNRPGIIVQETDLREMPTHEHRFSEPTPNAKANPFDYFQYSRLALGLPVLVCHQSKNGRWYYVETSIASGWVDARHIAFVDETFIDTWTKSPLSAITAERVPVGHPERLASIGTLLPTAGIDGVLVPIKGKNGQALWAAVTLPPDSCERMPLPMTPANVARLANKIIPQDYGWGGMFGLRDCSALTRDLMAPFGVYLPRNSRAQGRSGERISLANMTVSEKERTILREGVPFASLVVMNGHVMLYVGKYRGQAMILHNFWGIRVDEPKGEDDRLIIGRTVVTSIRPGKEVPNLHDNKTIGDRFHTLTIPTGAGR